MQPGKIKHLILNNGNKIPMIGIGTYKLSGDNLINSTLENAINLGYTHIDTAYKYNNEESIGNFLQVKYSQGFKREDFFITSKMWSTFTDPFIAIQESLNKLKVEYLDLFLIHFPVTIKVNEKNEPILKNDGKSEILPFEIESIWQKMESLVEKNLTRNIGVSNFGIKSLEKILNCCKIKPAINQIEIHPYLQQKVLKNFCDSNNISIVGHSCFGGSNSNSTLLNDPILQAIAKKHKTSVFKIIISWLIEQDICVIPKSTNYLHLKDNLEIMKLDYEDLKDIGNLNKSQRFNHPAYFEYEIYL